jgi:hypothetical protein
LRLDSPSEKGNKGKLATLTEVSPFIQASQDEEKLYVGEGVSLSLALLPLPLVAKVVEDF